MAAAHGSRGALPAVRRAARPRRPVLHGLPGEGGGVRQPLSPAPVEAGRCTQCGGRALPDRILCAACAEEFGTKGRERTKKLQALRETCAHERWHIQRPVLLEVGERGVKVCLRSKCRACRKTRTETFWARPERLVECFVRLADAA